MTREKARELIREAFPLPYKERDRKIRLYKEAIELIGEQEAYRLLLTVKDEQGS